MDWSKALAHFENLVNQFEDIDRKGKTMPYTSVNGHMFSFLDKEGNLGLRLAKEELEKFLSDFKTTQMIQHGSLMKEYVKVPDKLLKDTNKLKPYFELSYDYVSGLKPKLTKKKKK